MTQQPFSRPGAIDLSGLKRPARRPPPGRRRRAARRPGGAERRGSAYAVDVTEQNFQAVLEASVTAPVVLVFYSPTRSPESATYGRTTCRRGRASTRAGSWPGWSTSTPPRRSPRPCRSPRCRCSMVVLDGRPVAQPIPGVLPLDEICAPCSTSSASSSPPRASPAGTSRAPPAAPAATRATEEAGRPALRRRPRTRSASGDIDGAVAEYQKLVDANPADTEAAGRAGDGQGAAAHPGRRPRRRPRPRPRRPRRRRRADPGRRPRPARRARRGRVHPAGRPGPAVRPATTATRRASTCSACSRRSATTTRACWRAGRTSPRRCSESRASRAPSGRPRAGRPAPGTASTRRSRARPRRRSGSTPGRRRARRRRRGAGRGWPCGPARAACRTSRPTPSTSSDSNGVTVEDAVLEVAAEERRLDVVAGEAPRHLGQVVGAEGEELGRLGDLVGGHGRARQLDHRADLVGYAPCPRSSLDRRGDLRRSRPGPGRARCTARHQRDHDLRLRVAAGGDPVGGGLEDRARPAS